jgi:multiple antibiotic resistance protein
MGTLDILVLLAITVGPLKAAAMFLSLTVGADPALKRQIVIRTVLASAIICAVFAIAGGAILRMFHVSIPALLIAGGIILFVFALRLVLGEEYEEAPKPRPQAPTVGLGTYPLAVPLMASPQGIVAITAIAVERPGFDDRLLLLGLVALQMVANLVFMLSAEKIFARVSADVLKVVMRIMGLLLCGLATQMVIIALQRLGVLAAQLH